MHKLLFKLEAVSPPEPRAGPQLVTEVLASVFPSLSSSPIYQTFQSEYASLNEKLLRKAKCWFGFWSRLSCLTGREQAL